MKNIKYHLQKLLIDKIIKILYNRKVHGDVLGFDIILEG